jgi:glycosyltransferase involved in cell wall biosynthesis
VHLNSSKAAAWGAFVAFMVGVPHVIFTVHGWPFKEYRNFIATFLIKEISRFTGILSNVVIVVSKEDERIGRQMFGLKKKVCYVPIALAPSNEMFTREQIEEFLFSGVSDSFKNEGTIRLVTIAEMTPNKGLIYGIDMMSILEKNAPGKFKYMIIGKGEEHALLSQTVEENKLVGSICFANFLPSNKPPLNLESETSRYLPAFDIFILPSIKEGMPYVLLEAAMAGLPIITTDVVKVEASDLSNIHFVPAGSGVALASEVEKVARSLTNSDKPPLIRPFSEMLTKTIELYSSK